MCTGHLPLMVFFPSPGEFNIFQCKSVLPVVGISPQIRFPLSSQLFFFSRNTRCSVAFQALGMMYTFSTGKIPLTCEFPISLPQKRAMCTPAMQLECAFTYFKQALSFPMKHSYNDKIKKFN